MVKTVSAQIRDVIIKSGELDWNLYSNKNKNSRTVKMYEPIKGLSDKTLNKIKKVYEDNNIPFKMRRVEGGYYGTSLIFYLPL